MPEVREYTYDIFISYAREDYSWVRLELHGILTRCVSGDGRSPRVFLDKSSNGLGPVDYTDELARAIQGSRRIILVYSSTYFKKDMTQWEMTKALQMDPTGKQGRIIPILMDAEAEELIPLKINHINYLDTRDRSWFSRLLTFLELEKRPVLRKMVFGAPVADVVVNNTLPPVTVLFSDRGNPGVRDEEVELESSGGGIQGSLRRKSHDGVAVFTDLSFRATVEGTCLTAKAPGYADAVSNTFAVRKLKSIAPGRTGGEVRTVPAGKSSQVVFFSSGRGYAVIHPEGSSGKAVVFDGRDKALGNEIQLPAYPRDCSASDQSAAVIGWKGEILRLEANGATSHFSMCPEDVPFAIPGHATFTDGNLLVGMWNGGLFRLDRLGGTEQLLQHLHGIQSFVSNSARVTLCDFFGNLIVFQNGREIFRGETEHIVRGMAQLEDRLVIVGETRAYQFCPAEGRLTPWPLRTGRIARAMPVPGKMLVLDSAGHGMFLDKELFMHNEFHVTAGAVPVCAGRKSDNTYVVFSYPDGTSALMKNAQVIYTHPSGFFGFDPRLRTVAVHSGAGLVMHSGEWLEEFCGKRDA